MFIRYVVPSAAAIAVLGVSAVATADTPSSAPASVRANAFYAARTESAAYQQYYAYAAAADRSGQAGLAGVWRTVGQVEYQDHWMNDIAIAGMYQSTNMDTNLRVAINQAEQTAKNDRAYAARNPSSAAAGVLRTVAGWEDYDAYLLEQALAGNVPSVPAVRTISIQASAMPHYSGSFYNDLTGGANSGLSDAALNWAEYTQFAHVAADTGHAHLATLFSGLALQERAQNWPAISNVAGYVNDNTANLQTSIASEQGAIQMYNKFATQAQQAGDPTTAKGFLSRGADERGHQTTFTTELRHLTGM
jgi:rubrerythrin